MPVFARSSQPALDHLPDAPLIETVPNHAAMPFVFVTALFLTWGFVTSVIDGLAPAVREIFRLSYGEQMLTQFAFFLAYGLVSVPASALLARLGAPNLVLAALGAMLAGCVLVAFGAAAASYPAILAALFVIACGVTLLQVAANPLSAAMGHPRGAHFRLTLSQAFNSLGAVFGPLLASRLLLRNGLFDPYAFPEAREQARAISLRNVSHQFGIMALVVVALAVFVWAVRHRLRAPHTVRLIRVRGLTEAFRSPWGLFGAFAIFLYVGAEVGVGTVMVNFLSQPGILDVSPARAASLLAVFFWGGAMVGRFCGSQLLRFVPANYVLGLFAVVNVLLCLAVSQTLGREAGVAALSIGFFNSVMFPTIFSLTLERSDAPAAAVSGLLCTAIVGGAVLPPILGIVSDRSGLSAAFAVPMVGYVGIAVFAVFDRARPVRRDRQPARTRSSVAG